MPALSQMPPSPLAAIPADITLLASLPSRPDLLALLPSSSSAASFNAPPTLASPPADPSPAPSTPPQTADAALPIARSLMAATASSAGSGANARAAELERVGERVDGLRAQLEEVRDGLRDGAELRGWGPAGGKAGEDESLA